MQVLLLLATLLLCVPTRAFHDEFVALTCMPCNSSEYCHEGLRYRCPDNSLSDPDFRPRSIDDCVCVPGYLRVNDACVLGPAPFWYAEGVKQTCAEYPLRATIVDGAYASWQCVCVPGHSETLLPGRCSRCPRATYNTLFNSTCLQCPIHSSHVDTARVHVTDCTCDPGYTGPDGGPCESCPLGDFKALNGSAPCDTCGINTYSNGSSASSCVQCHANSTASAGSSLKSDCLCDPGFELLADECVQCVPGKFKGGSGNEACQLCGTDSEFANAPGATTCISCFENSHSRDTRERCFCDEGYIQQSETVVHPTCSACPVNTFQNKSGMTACVLCDAFAQSAEASPSHTSCVCNAGFFEQSYDTGACEVCIPGKYKDVVDDTVLVCTQCPPNSESFPGSPGITSCQCSPGFEGELGGPCESCALGKYKLLAGDSLCEECAADSYSDSINASVCTPCFAFAVAPPGSDSIDDCLCDFVHGYSEFELEGERACSLCEPGKFATDMGFETRAGCANCSVGTFTYESGRTICDFCAPNTSSHSSPRVECECDPGFRCKDGLMACDGDCEACEADTFKSYAGYSDSCSLCQSNAQSPAASTSPSDCLCNSGYFHEQEYSVAGPYTCGACAPGSYTDEPGALTCLECPLHHFTPPALFPWDKSADCIACGLCPEHKYDGARDGLGCGSSVQTSCEVCPQDSGTFHDDTFEDRNINVSACSCNAGYYGPLGGPCQQCPVGFVKTERLGRDTTLADCTECPPNTYMATQDSPCRDCLAHSTSVAGSSQKQHCQCDAGRENADLDVLEFLQQGGYTNESLIELQSQELPKDFAGAFEDQGLTVCRRCSRGRYKREQGAQECEPCPVDQFQNNTGSTECEHCPDHLSSHEEATVCFCDPAYENVDGAYHDCTLCNIPTYKTEYGDQRCTECDSCGVDEQVDSQCHAGSNITCKPCQANSWTQAGRNLKGPCLCKAGFQLELNGSHVDGSFYGDGWPDGFECLQCHVGKFRTTDTNNSIPCQTCEALTFTTVPGTVSCVPCTALCDDSHDTSTRAFYVSSECTPSSDIVCSACTVCPVRFYANRTCGAGNDNDRTDTTCAECPVDSYCPGNGTGVLACPLHSHRFSAGASPQDCDCAPGYYQVNISGDGSRITDVLGLPSHKCEPCPFDTYCTGDGLISRCPNNSFTFDDTNANRLDCNCFRGYYRSGSTEAFECPICTANDFCFNNTRYNCSDDRMLSDEGSKYFANCTCMSGYYNNESKCEQCPVDTFCLDGVQQACPPFEWTNGRVQQSTCVCRPGYFSPSLPLETPKNCQLCLADTFCPGEDDTKTNCTSHSTSRVGSSSELDCLCLPGFENSSMPHTCVACASSFVKESTSNTACVPCTVCLSSDGVYELQACRPDFDAMCNLCNPCTNGSIYTSQLCADKFDALCSACRVCDYQLEYMDTLCNSQENTVCRNITYDLVCPVGQYAGAHTERLNSKCQNCLYRDTPYFGQRLHEAVSRGEHYNDAYSCRIQCLGLSRIVDVNNHSLGCESCENGNVLLREFNVVRNSEELKVSCEFTCRQGFEYDATRNDCFAPTLRSSESNTFTHSINISNWERSLSGFLFTITHTNHSRFVVLAGRSPPTSCRVNECCFGHLWRVSELSQMGLSDNTNESCSRVPPLTHSKIFSDTLQFEIPDSDMGEVAHCVFKANATRECTLFVSLVDIVLRRSISQTIVISTRRAETYAFFNGAHRYIPMDFFKVDVLLAYTEPKTGSSTFLIITQARSVHGPMNVTLRVPGMSPTQTVCPHFQPENGTEFPLLPSSIVGEDSLSSFVTFWRGPDTAETIRLFYSLRSSAYDVMDVAVVRNVTLLTPTCTEHKHSSVIQLGFIDATAGLGEPAVTAMHRIHDITAPSLTTRGEMGSLVSFVAEAYSPIVTEIGVKSILAAHLAGSFQTPVNATKVTEGVLDFQYQFRQWCRAPGSNTACVYEYLHLDSRQRTMFVIRDCSPASRTAAKAWLSATFGVVSDGGHVDALCSRMASSTNKAISVMVNTLAYMPKNSPWNSFQNFSLPSTRTFVWPDFYFKY